MAQKPIDLVRVDPDSLPILLRRCIMSVLERQTGKGITTPKEFESAAAICLASLQKARSLKENTTILTGQGRSRNSESRRKPDTLRKMRRYEIIIKQVREALDR